MKSDRQMKARARQVAAEIAAAWKRAKHQLEADGFSEDEVDSVIEDANDNPVGWDEPTILGLPIR